MGEGDVNVHCIASYEDVGTLKTLLRSRCCYVEDAVTLKMLERWRCCYVDDVGTFKMLLRWRCCYSIQDVVTLKMLLRWRCCYVEDVVTLKMLLRWRSFYGQDVVTLKMLVRWRCCYVEDVVAFKMLWRCYVEEKKGPCAFRPWFSGGLWHFYVYQKNLKFQKASNSYGENKNDINWWTWKKNKKHWNTACWTNSWYSHVIGRTQNTNCLPGNAQPLPYYIYIYLYIVFPLTFCHLARLWITTAMWGGHPTLGSHLCHFGGLPEVSGPACPHYVQSDADVSIFFNVFRGTSATNQKPSGSMTRRPNDEIMANVV